MSAVEIRTYEGDGSDLAGLIVRTWKTTFGGKMWFPLWDQAYLSWRLLDDRGGGRDFLIAAYQGSKIVGCLLAEPFNLRVRDKEVRGTLSSFLSVDPDLKVPNLAFRLVEALRKRHYDHGMAISVGCTSADPNAPNRRFWDYLAQRKPEDYRFLGPIRFWTRVFDSGAVSAAGFTAFERIGPRFSGLIPLPSPRRSKAPGVRDFHTADLSRCLDWVQTQSQDAAMHIRWSPQRLDLQLNHPYVRTLVFEGRESAAEGAFINYYLIDWSGARAIRVAMIDLFAGPARLLSQLALLKAAERRMMAEGTQLALMMVSSAAPPRPLLAAGFVPVPRSVDLFSLFPDPGLGLESRMSYHLLFT
jgi:hypothetical protein